MEDLEIHLPLDSEGYLLRACPNCQKEFKLHALNDKHAKTQAVELSSYHCPLCGTCEEADSFFTSEQLEYIDDIVSGELGDHAIEVFARTADAFDGSLITTPSLEEVTLPPLEPDDMKETSSPCHSVYNLKVQSATEHDSLFCLACGSTYTA